MERNTLKRVARLAVPVFAVAFVLAATPAPADITDINSVVVQERRFNDFPSSNLTTVNNFPTEVSFTEHTYGAGGWANQHVARFSADGTTARVLQNGEAFDIRMDVTLDAGSLDPTKEAGFRLDTFIGGEGFFIIKTNGEAAAFGGPFPFHSFGGSAYTPGTKVTMGMIYTPDDDADPWDGDAATMEYIFDADGPGPLAPQTSGPLNFGNSENGIINNSDLGAFGLFVPNQSNPGDFAQAKFEDFSIAVPEPATLCLLALGGVAVLRRR